MNQTKLKLVPKMTTYQAEINHKHIIMLEVKLRNIFRKTINELC